MRTILLAIGVISLAIAHPAAMAQSTTTCAEVCSNYVEVMREGSYPREAIAQNLKQGSALVEFTLTAEGQVTNVRAIESSHPIFAAAAEGIVAKFQCKGLGKSVQIRVPLGYLLQD